MFAAVYTKGFTNVQTVTCPTRSDSTSSDGSSLIWVVPAHPKANVSTESLKEYFTVDLSAWINAAANPSTARSCNLKHSTFSQHTEDSQTVLWTKRCIWSKIKFNNRWNCEIRFIHKYPWNFPTATHKCDVNFVFRSSRLFDQFDCHHVLELLTQQKRWKQN